MTIHQPAPSAIVAAATLLVTGCASIISGRYADVHIDSHPANAHVLVRDERGREVASVNTPAVVSLRRNRRFFLPARYTATFETPGYHSVNVPLRSTINPWVTGNLVLGGPLGLVVDNATGAAWKPKHEQISQHLTPIYAAQNTLDRRPSDSATLSANPAQDEAEQNVPARGIQPAAAIY